MKILPFKAVHPNLDQVPHTNEFFDTVKMSYRDYAVEGLFQKNDQEAIYIYQIKNAEGRKFTGIVACTDIKDYLDGHIKKHEKTIVTNEELQSELLHTRGAAIKPILLTYPSVKELNDLIFNYLDSNKKFYVIQLGKEKHRFWKVSESDLIQKIQTIFAEKIPVSYIADGHHRSASFAALHEQLKSEKSEKMLCAYFAEEELEINAYNRIISNLNGLTADTFLEKLLIYFKIKVLKKGEKPYAKFEMTMYLEGRWFQLNWRKTQLKGFADGLVQLDVHLLNEKILKPVLGVKNIRTDERVKYLEGSKSIESIEKATPTEGVTFCVFPVEFEDMKEISDSDGTMPPKSTFFEPRMKNGLLIYEI